MVKDLTFCDAQKSSQEYENTGVNTIEGDVWRGSDREEYYDKVFTYTQPAVFGEIAFMLWLVIKGARPPALAAVLSSAAG